MATVTLHRPEVRNAIDPELLDELALRLGELDDDPAVGAVVLTGTDPAFCSGLDLRHQAEELRRYLRQRLGRYSPETGLLPVHRPPVVGAVNGAAVAAGLELALGCDVLVASDRARFADTYARIGAMPGGGLTVRLPALVGVDRARRMSFTGDFVDAARAERWGLVSEVVPHDRLLGRARELAAAMAAVGPGVLDELGRMFTEVGARRGPEAWRLEARWSYRWMRDRFDETRLDEARRRVLRPADRPVE